MLRPLEPGDADRFAALVRRAFTGLDVDPPLSAMRVTGDDVRNHFAQGGGGLTTQAAEAGLMWMQKEGGLYIGRVAVDPVHRRKGLASLLIHAAEAEAIRMALPRLWLSTRLALAGNRRLFGRLGFVEIAYHAHPGYAAPTFVDMEKRIGGELTGRPSV